MSGTRRMLVVEDNPADIALLRSMLRGSAPACDMEICGRLDEALGVLATRSFDLALVDLTLPDARGADETVQAIRVAAPNLPVVVLTALDDPDMAVRSLQLGAQDYLVKGHMDRELLVRTIDYSIERQRSREEMDRIARELLEANRRLEMLSVLDPLTELPNRRGLDRSLASERQRAVRDGEPLLAVLVDLDDFKRINDTLGHAAGDLVLREVAHRLRAALRATDHVARIGRDEFLVLLPDTRPAEGWRVAEKVRIAIAAEPVRIGSSATVDVTPSLGIVEVQNGDGSIDRLLESTHVALSRSKRAGKNRVSGAVPSGEVPFAVPHDPAAERSADLDVIAALAGGRGLSAVAQPVFRLEDEVCVGYEFFARFDAPGFEYPGEFLRAARDAGALGTVDRHCLAACLGLARTFAPSLRRFVNLHPQTLRDTDVQEVIDAFETLGGEGEYCIDLSEEQIVGEPSFLVQPVEEFKKAGLRVALDDLGFGRSSLEALILLEPDMVKIDHKYVKGVADDPVRRRLLVRLLRVVEARGAAVLAEGIESRRDLKVLRELGVTFGCGYVWGEPS